MIDTSQIPQTEFDPVPRAGEGLGRIAARSSMAVGLAKAIRYAFVFVVHVLLMNLLDPDDFGLVRYVTIVLGVLNLVNEAGLGVAIVQKKKLGKAELAPVFTLNLVLSMGLYCIAFVLAPVFASFFGEKQLTDLIRVGAIAVPVSGVSVVHRAMLQRRFRYGRLAGIEVAGAIAGASVSLALAFAGFGVWSLVWGTVTFFGLSTTLLFVNGPWFGGYFTAVERALPLFAFGVAMVCQRIIDYGARNVDYLVVGKTFGATALGVYGVAYDIVTLPQLALGVVLANVALSALSRFQDDNDRLNVWFIRLTVVVSIAATPFLVLVGGMAPDLMHAVTFLKPSTKWLPAAGPLRVLVPVGILYSFTSYPGILWIAKGRAWLRVGWALLALVTVCAAVLIGRVFGMMGVCWALLIRAILLFPVVLFVTQHVVGLSPLRYLRSLVPAVACGAAMLGVVLAVAGLVPGGSPAAHVSRVLAAGAAGTGAYLLVLYIVFREAWHTVNRLLHSAFSKGPSNGEG
ncbi:MAG: oligosaccharide flippase family protein [Chitinivibrionales bacterium]|nr:oligosaccharide flippase family protein [Chitinivibrionales bacterium]MBD3394207.1 oligosaccharide flippase family protein [Chitinivibrionales bacterium]